MSDPGLSCRVESRRKAVLAGAWNGLDYAEVSDAPPSLCVHFFGPIPEGLKPSDFRIEGGRRIRDLKITGLEVHPSGDPEVDDCLRLGLDRAGDFSTYRLCLLLPESQESPWGRFDPRYTCLDFRFKQDCPADLDCGAPDSCPPRTYDDPDLNYLAKDYASFRQLILDRMALLVPGWREGHVPDLGLTLVELLAYVGDHLSYFQDSVATEAYLDTARQRISVRRHARLVDYRLHEGCNARAWLTLASDADTTLDLGGCFFTTAFPGSEALATRVITSGRLSDLPDSSYEAFEPMETGLFQIYAAHSEIAFYTWGDQACCLAEGATSATLLDEGGGEIPARVLHLMPGDRLIFEEALGPRTGDPADADPARRHVVRLTGVTPHSDPVLGHQVLDITWTQADALPFELCLSAFLPAPDCRLLTGISVARGNVLLVDHGRRAEDPFGPLPTEEILGECLCEGSAVEVWDQPGTFRPKVPRQPLTAREALPQDPSGSSVDLLRQDPRSALAALRLYGLPPMSGDEAALLTPGVLEDPTAFVQRLLDPHDLAAQAVRARLSLNTRELLEEASPGQPLDADLLDSLEQDLARLMPPWEPRFDLLSSGPLDRDLVVETDNDGWAHLRFGDGELGRAPEAGGRFQARYRVGNGPSGNVGADTLRFLALRRGALGGVDLRPRNPMPAVGGIDPEMMAEAKLLAPSLFKVALKRAITARDYATIAAEDPRLQAADAELRWTGSWYEARVAVDPLGREDAPEELVVSVEGALERVRRMGHDLAVREAVHVPLDIELRVCVLPGYLRAAVAADLEARFGTGVLPDGTKAFFHPDNLSFGAGLPLSRIVALAQGVPGVQHVEVTKLERLFEGPNGELAKGYLPLAHGEIAQVDNDPSFPEHGRLRLDMRGGR